MRRRRALPTLASLAIPLAIATDPVRGQAPDLGKPFPDVWLPRLDGGHASISSLRGEKLLVLVYASW